MQLLTAITYLALSRLTSAAQCAAEAYAGAGPGNTCTGAALASAAQSGEGSGQCQLATNAACVDIVHEVGGSDCSVLTYSGLDCDFDDWNNFLACDNEGDTLQDNFGSFRVECSA